MAGTRVGSAGVGHRSCWCAVVVAIVSCWCLEGVGMLIIALLVPGKYMRDGEVRDLVQRRQLAWKDSASDCTSVLSGTI